MTSKEAIASNAIVRPSGLDLLMGKRTFMVLPKEKYSVVTKSLMHLNRVELKKSLHERN